MTHKKNAAAAVLAAASGAGVSTSFDPPTAAGDGIPGTHTRESEAAKADGASPSAGAAERSYIGDEFWGRGGRYIVGPDGIRRPATHQE